MMTFLLAFTTAFIRSSCAPAGSRLSRSKCSPTADVKTQAIVSQMRMA